MIQVEISAKIDSATLAEVLALVREHELSYAKIGARFGLSATTVCSWAKMHGLQRTGKPRVHKIPETLTQAILMEILTYDLATGAFARRADEKARVGWIDELGYLHIRLGRRRLYLAHRLAWLYVYGRWPKGNLDHINGDPSDNRIANLRECNQTQNMANSKLVHKTSSIRKGVSYDKTRKKYRAYIRIDGKSTLLGRYATVEEAIAVRVAAERRLHGAFART